MEFSREGWPILDQFSEEGFVDCVFKVVDLRTNGDVYEFVLKASFEEQLVGMAVRINRVIGPGFDEDMNVLRDHVYRSGVVFSSIGEESDRLVSALAGLYGFEPTACRMVQKESFTLIALQQEDTDLSRHHVRMKLFGRDDEADAEDDYYESFFRLDLPQGLAYWNEKDEDYRAPLLRALTSVQ